MNFIQDAVKFPDRMHAVKPEPHNEIPQAASAHETFWDFISQMPESMHNPFTRRNTNADELKNNDDAVYFINEAYKPVAANKEGEDFLMLIAAGPDQTQ
ncbi:hypothetical protein BH10BAC4_BH10BAC4_17820 [soil metagenome]